MIAHYDYDSLDYNALFDCVFPKDIYEIETSGGMKNGKLCTIVSPMPDFDYMKYKIIGKHSDPFIIKEYTHNGKIRLTRTFCKPDISICCESDSCLNFKIEYDKEKFKRGTEISSSFKF